MKKWINIIFLVIGVIIILVLVIYSLQTRNHNKRKLGIYGKIVTPDGKGISGVEVSIPQTIFKTASDKHGNFFIKYNPGDVELIFSHTDYIESHKKLFIKQIESFDLEKIILYPIPEFQGVYAVVNGRLRKIVPYEAKLNKKKNESTITIFPRNRINILPEDSLKFIINKGNAAPQKIMTLDKIKFSWGLVSNVNGIKINNWEYEEKINIQNKISKSGENVLEILNIDSLQSGYYLFDNDIFEDFQIQQNSSIITYPFKVIKTATDFPELKWEQEDKLIDVTGTVIKEIFVSSSLPRYGPDLLIDGNPKTAWNEGGKSWGKGEWILLEFDHEIKLKGVLILPGLAYTDSPEYGNLFLANNRPSQLWIVSSDYQKIKVNFPDEPQPVKVSLNGNSISWLKVIIESVYYGERWDDTCISEIRIFE